MECTLQMNGPTWTCCQVSMRRLQLIYYRMTSGIDFWFPGLEEPWKQMSLRVGVKKNGKRKKKKRFTTYNTGIK